MKFDYYYGSQADQFNFIRIPKAMLTDKIFASLSLQAKMLYGILLDRMGLSMKNGWFDSENKVYIIYQIAEIQEDLGFTKKKAIEYLGELERFGLVEKKRRGLGLPSILYVKSFLIKKDCSRPDFKETEISRGSKKNTSAKVEVVASKEEHYDVAAKVTENHPLKQTGKSRSVSFDTSRGADFDTSRSADLTHQEERNWAPLINNIKEKDIKDNNIKSNHIISAQRQGSSIIGYDCDMMREMAIYEEIIKENIAFDDLLVAYPYETETIEGIAQLILETVLNKNESMIISTYLFWKYIRI